MDVRESTRFRTPSKTPKRFRSASSPYESPHTNIINELPDTQADSPLSPLIGSPLQGLKRYGFKVVRKRRATIQDTMMKRTSSPARKTPKREITIRSAFARPHPPSFSNKMTDQDYVLQEDNLVSSPDEEEVFASLSEVPVVADIIRRRPVNLPGNDRRPSALMRKNIGDSPISYRTKRCLSLCSPTVRGREFRGRGLRERNRSVNDYNIPQKDLNPALMDQHDLTGDFKRILSLPLATSGKHQDLKYINSETLVDLQQGRKDISATIIDARYPYEYRGGHINGAINLYTPEMVTDYFYGSNKENWMPPGNNNNTEPQQRKIVVFHCEFSSERAPALLRFLRKSDRAKNRYPALDFPELYLLKDGYKQFFTGQMASTGGNYIPMLDGKYTQELRHFRKKCKTPNNKI